MRVCLYVCMSDEKIVSFNETCSGKLLKDSTICLMLISISGSVMWNMATLTVQKMESAKRKACVVACSAKCMLIL